MIDMLYGARNEIIGGIVLMLLAWCWHKFRMMLKKYKTMKHELARMREEITRLGATKEEHERLTRELQQKDEALRQSVAKAHEDSRLIEELRNQVEALQQELQRKDEALSQSEAKAHEDSRLITELRSQTEARQKELQRKDEALSQSAAKSQEDSRRITELRSQIEALQQEKAKKKIPPMSDSDFLELCQYGDTKKVEQTILNGVNVNATRTYDGRTALMLAAAFSKNPEVIKILVNAGADIHAEDNYGRTALRWAKIYGNTETADLLRRYGAK